MQANFTPFPVLETERLILRALLPTDDMDSFALRNDDRVNQYLKDYRHADIGQTREWIQKIIKGVANNENVLWVITLKDTHAFMGNICIWNIDPETDKAELGYTLLPQYHRMGYMHESLEKVLDYVFNTMQLKRLEAYTSKNNTPSASLLLKSNFLQYETITPEEPDYIAFVLQK